MAKIGMFTIKAKPIPLFNGIMLEGYLKALRTLRMTIFANLPEPKMSQLWPPVGQNLVKQGKRKEEEKWPHKSGRTR